MKAVESVVAEGFACPEGPYVDADGILHVKWPVAGWYWISATQTDAGATTPRATERRMSYTMTVEVPAP